MTIFQPMSGLPHLVGRCRNLFCSLLGESVRVCASRFPGAHLSFEVCYTASSLGSRACSHSGFPPIVPWS